MITYQDLTAAATQEKRIKLIEAAISEHKSSEAYKTAQDAIEYDKHRNVTIGKYQKLLYTLSGAAVPDNYTANHKISSGFFPFFVTQQNQYLLGNGATLEKTENKEKLGRKFDIVLQKLGRDALVCGVSFGFWNHDHLEAFTLTEFAPLWDESTGKLAAGIRFWQIDAEKPLHVTLYEPDGYEQYIKQSDGELQLTAEKTSYIQLTRTSPADGTEIIGGENYSTLPIVPLWGNPHRQSEIVGIRSQIDAFDLIKSGFANDLDDASMIYWTLTNTCGMDDIDLARFIEHMKTVKAAVVDGDSGVKAEAHTIDVPYASRVAYLERLEKDLYQDYQALNISEISSGNKTATEIRAAYQPIDNKADQYEYCVLEFLEEIFALAGVEDKPSFIRSRISNQTEETQMVLLAAQYLDDETLLKKLPWLTPEEVTAILDNRDIESLSRFGGNPPKEV